MLCILWYLNGSARLIIHLNYTYLTFCLLISIVPLMLPMPLLIFFKFFSQRGRGSRGGLSRMSGRQDAATYNNWPGLSSTTRHGGCGADGYTGGRGKRGGGSTSSGLFNKNVHIKKPLNAFMLFMKEMRSLVQEECTLKESAAINQVLGKKWHELTREEQTKYYEMARREKELHKQLYPNWSARDNYAFHARQRKRRRHLLHRHAMQSRGGGGGPLRHSRLSFRDSKMASSSLALQSPPPPSLDERKSRLPWDGHQLYSNPGDAHRRKASDSPDRPIVGRGDIYRPRGRKPSSLVYSIRSPFNAPARSLSPTVEGSLHTSPFAGAKHYASSRTGPVSPEPRDEQHTDNGPTLSGKQSFTAATTANDNNNNNPLSFVLNKTDNTHNTPEDEEEGKKIWNERPTSIVSRFSESKPASSQKLTSPSGVPIKSELKDATDRSNSSQLPTSELSSASASSPSSSSFLFEMSALKKPFSKDTRLDHATTTAFYPPQSKHSEFLPPKFAAAAAAAAMAGASMNFSHPPSFIPNSSSHSMLSSAPSSSTSSMASSYYRQHNHHQYFSGSSALQQQQQPQQQQQHTSPTSMYSPSSMFNSSRLPPLHYPPHPHPPPPSSLFGRRGHLEGGGGTRQGVDSSAYRFANSSYGGMFQPSVGGHRPDANGLRRTNNNNNSAMMSAPNASPSSVAAVAAAAAAAMAATELSGGSLKKCRARFGLEHQNMWCKPCR